MFTTMDASASTRATGRCLAGAAAVGAMWWIAFEQHERIPILTYVNLGLHEFGHFVTYGFSELTTAMAGSVAQVLIPALLAAYFIARGDWLGTGLCLAWGATSAREVAAYVADAKEQKLELIGGSHDWALILGPDHYDALGQAPHLAHIIHSFATVAIVVGFVLCVAAALRAAAHAPQAPTPAAR